MAISVRKSVLLMVLGSLFLLSGFWVWAYTVAALLVALLLSAGAILLFEGLSQCMLRSLTRGGLI